MTELLFVFQDLCGSAQRFAYPLPVGALPVDLTAVRALPEFIIELGGRLWDLS